MIPNRELFVDTGINTGWAYFDGTLYPKVGCIYSRPKTRKTLENYIRFMSVKFYELFSSIRLFCHAIEHVTIEHPEVWQTAGKGKAAIESGSLLHLAANAYSYAGICTLSSINFTLVTAKQWKGSLTKEATAYRVKMINGKTYDDNDHIIDAVGIGFSRDKDLWQLKNKK